MIAMVGNLTEQIGMKGNRPILLCHICGNEYSANKGDYWNYSNDYVITCCGRPMEVVTKHILYKSVRKGV